jgi:hypothetical protein
MLLLFNVKVLPWPQLFSLMLLLFCALLSPRLFYLPQFSHCAQSLLHSFLQN